MFVRKINDPFYFRVCRGFSPAWPGSVKVNVKVDFTVRIFSPIFLPYPCQCGSISTYEYSYMQVLGSTVYIDWTWLQSCGVYIDWLLGSPLTSKGEPWKPQQARDKLEIHSSRVDGKHRTLANCPDWALTDSTHSEIENLIPASPAAVYLA